MSKSTPLSIKYRLMKKIVFQSEEVKKNHAMIRNSNKQKIFLKCNKIIGTKNSQRTTNFLLRMFLQSVLKSDTSLIYMKTEHKWHCIRILIQITTSMIKKNSFIAYNTRKMSSAEDLKAKRIKEHPIILELSILINTKEMGE